MDRIDDSSAAAVAVADAAGPPVVLDIRNADAYYGKAQILFGVSITVRRGEVVAVIGANGAGKSTTLNLVMGRLQPTNGTVELEGRSIAGVATERHHRLGCRLRAATAPHLPDADRASRTWMSAATCAATTRRGSRARSKRCVRSSRC